jgi:hypothetical protein
MFTELPEIATLLDMLVPEVETVVSAPPAAIVPALVPMFKVLPALMVSVFTLIGL